jgi:hypothetical protein
MPAPPKPPEPPAAATLVVLAPPNPLWAAALTAVAVKEATTKAITKIVVVFLSPIYYFSFFGLVRMKQKSANKTSFLV